MAEKSKRPQFETTLAYMAVGVIGASILSMLLTLVAALLGFTELPVVFAQLPLIGLPIGFLIIVTMLIFSIIRRSKENRS
ncbi:MAG: hypothetical protein K9G13_02595 [Aquiluna sp.]|jgi:uncharacterized membrane protein YhdT|nr:hypothetical protein [Aquiluna sp.]MCF8545412.1 hypothetical protein [Aquiluna sp.]